MNGSFPAGFPLLSVVTLLPLAGAVAVLLLRRHRAAARGLAVALAIMACALAACTAMLFTPGVGMQFHEWHAWETTLGLGYHLGLDGLGLVMLAVSALVILMAMAASWSNPQHGPSYYALLLFLESALLGTFTALNFLHWFLYWELSLVPAFFLIRIYGGPGRARAATQFFVYSMAGSLPLLLAFLALFVANGTLDLIALAHLAQAGRLHGPGGGAAGMLLFWAAFLGFAVKTPVVPFHTWLPDAYSEAAPETAMVLTGALSKMGLYGFLRILLPIFGPQMHAARPLLLSLAVASIVLPAFAAWAQTDLRRMFAYSSINHLGYCVLATVAVASAAPGVRDEQAAALTGVMLQLFSHGVTAAALFWFLALLGRRSGGLLGIDDFGGLRSVAPVFAGLMGITLFASIGLPGLIGFPGEFLIFKGVFPLARWSTVLALPGLMMTAVFLLMLMQRVFSGPLRHPWETMADLNATERWTLAPVIGLMFLVGLYPQMLARFLPGTIGQILSQVRY